MRKKEIKVIDALGVSLSTTALTMAGMPKGGRSPGQEVVVSLPMSGATKCYGQSAFDLSRLPGLLAKGLQAMQAQGCEFAPGGVLSLSVRQHDMVLMRADGQPLIPALSWQCDAATAEVAWLQQQKAEAVVGKLEPRLLLPKLLWALKQLPTLAQTIRLVMTTGDYITLQLTGTARLSSSEAASNGLLDQRGRQFPAALIDSIGQALELPWMTNWFPPVIPSGQLVPKTANSPYCTADWNQVRELLPDWQVAAIMGDNHAGALGSGLTDDGQTMVISAGTSGTVVRAVQHGTNTAGQALRFEFFDKTLLLLMMARCACLYSLFRRRFTRGRSHAWLNCLASLTQNAWELPCLPKMRRFPRWFAQLPLGQQVKTIQHAIAKYLVELFVQLWRDEVRGAVESIRRVVLTGGLTASPYFCRVLRDGISEAGFDGKVLKSSRTGPLANQAAALGALINALVAAGFFADRAAAIEALCPVEEI